MLTAVERTPKLELPLTRIQKFLKRSDEQIEYHLGKASEFYRARVLQNPADADSRIAYAETLMLAEKPGDAERVLKEGLVNGNSPKLRASLASLYSSTAASQLRESFLNQERCSAMIAQAIALDPSNLVLLQQAINLTAIGAKWTTKDLSPAIEDLK